MKKEIWVGARVVVEPYNYIHTRDNVISTAESILRDIERHVDYVAKVYIEHETKEICSFCGYRWDDSGTGYNGCCEEDAEEESRGEK